MADDDISNFTVEKQLGTKGGKNDALPPPACFMPANNLPVPQNASSQAVPQPPPMPTNKRAQMEKFKDRKESDDVRKKRMLKTIDLYFDRFSWLSGRVPRPSARAGINEVEEVLSMLREEMASQRSMSTLMKYKDFFAAMVDSLWGDGSKLTFLPPAARLNLSGFSKVVSSGTFDEEIVPLLQEIDIEYPWLGRQSLFIRSLQCITSIMAQVHLHNVNGKGLYEQPTPGQAAGPSPQFPSTSPSSASNERRAQSAAAVPAPAVAAEPSSSTPHHPTTSKNQQT